VNTRSILAQRRAMGATAKHADGILVYLVSYRSR
jgi:hypothetical protein